MVFDTNKFASSLELKLDDAASDLPFFKVQSGGNHFLVIDARQDFKFNMPHFARAFSHSQFGLASDGVVFLVASKYADIGIKYFNQDGSEAFCGNGTRAAALIMKTEGIIPAAAESIEMETSGGVIRLAVNKLSLRMPKHKIIESPDCVDSVSVSLGNPNAVVFVDSLEEINVLEQGKAVSEKYPEGANVIFAQVKGTREVYARFWERGVGETLSCGSGICALLAAGIQTGKLLSPLTILTPGGTFQAAGKEQFELRGPVTLVAEGKFNAREVIKFYHTLANPNQSLLF